MLHVLKDVEHAPMLKSAIVVSQDGPSMIVLLLLLKPVLDASSLVLPAQETLSNVSLVLLIIECKKENVSLLPLLSTLDVLWTLNLILSIPDGFHS